jgi:Helix-turn-helix domain
MAPLARREDTPPSSTPIFLNLIEGAFFLRCSPESLGNSGWRRRHKIPTLKLGNRLRFQQSALQAWLEARSAS